MHAFVGASLFLVAISASSQSLEFKGVPMGASLEDLRQVPGLANLRCPIEDNAGNSNCWISNPDFTYADQAVKTFSADFLAGKLAQISILTLGGSGEVIESALKSKYGAPSRRYKESQTLKNGAAYKMSVREWRVRGGGMISIQDHPAPVNQMFTALISPQWLAWQKSARTASKKARSDI